MLFQTHRVDIVSRFSDFLAFLPTFKKSYDKTIADIEDLIKSAKTVRESSAIRLIMDAKASINWPHQNE